VKGVSI